MRLTTLAGATLAAAAVAAACDGPTSPFGEALLRVESVEVLILLSLRPR